MKESIFEMASGIAKERMDDALNLMKTDFKGVAPFGKKPKSMDEQLYEYSTLTPETLTKMIDEQGENDVNQWLGDMVKAKERRERNGNA